MTPRTDLGRVLKAAPALLRMGTSETVVYRAEFIIWMLTATLPLIMLALWDAVARGGPVEGYGRAEFARYFTVTLIARQFTSSWVVWELNEEIRTGKLSPHLLRPVGPIWLHAARTLAAMPLRALVLLPLVGALFWWRPDMGLPTEMWRWGAFALAVTVGWTIGFSVQCIFGMVAFWFDRSVGLYYVWFGFFSLLGGYLIPVDLLPPDVVPLVQWLPFRAMLGLCIEIGAGILPREGLELELAIQAGWAVVFAGLAMLTWRRGLARYGAFGA